MKRIVLALLLVLVLMCGLIACGNSQDNTTESTDSGTTNDSNSTNDSSSDPCAGGHAFGEWKTIRQASCTQVGLEARTCTACKKVESNPIEASGHNIVILEAVEGSCTQDGYTEGKKCSSCGLVEKEQERIPKEEFHKYTELVSVISTPSLSSAGKATFKCSLCGDTSNVDLDKLSSSVLTKKDVYNIETNDPFNPAVDNVWKVVDGNKNTAGIYNTGDDWFGNVGDTLIITLKQEIILTDLKMYTAGNWTFADVVVKNAKGQQTAKVANVKANGSAYGGTAETQNVLSNKSIKAYTIEITIKDNKNSYMNYKIAEVEIKGAKPDVRLPHDHVYREYVKDTTPATCSKQGKAEYACYCNATSEKATPITDHKYTVLTSSKPVTCTENGKNIFKCETCNNSIEQRITAKGHIYAKLVSYISQPTNSQKGKATFKCIGCDLTSDKDIKALPLGKVEHLRVTGFAQGTVTLSFNVYGEKANYEVRCSTEEITSDNFNSAMKLNTTIKGDGEYTTTVNLAVNLNNCYYVAIRPYIGDNYGELATIRLGGNKLIPIDYHSGNVYHGEVLNSFANLFDEQSENKEIPKTVLARIFRESDGQPYYGMNLSPIVDLEYMHYVSSVYLYYADAGSEVKVRWSDTPVDAYANDSLWDGTYQLTSTSGWNEIAINSSTRYIQVIFKDGYAPYEMLAYGFQNGEGDKIATSIGSLPTIGEMIGMCGFVAAGAGNTPIDSVICTNILREYHKFSWSYDIKNYPNKTTYFSGSWMGDFESQYKNYSLAGINVIPCIQWDLANTPLSYKVDENNLPKKSGDSFIKGDFYEKMNPYTYFAYADNMFSFAARFGTNDAISDVLFLHALGPRKSGLGYIKWIELGNEPDGVWNGIDNYYSAYQLAALTSAGYDGHGSKLTSSVIHKGYHFGVKNGDPNMKAAMAGVSAVSNEYITALCYWMKANREDRMVAFDAFNVHCYMTKPIELSNGLTYTVGASPEEAGLVKTLSQLIAIRDKYYPEKEVWITEFGWDTNQSYATVTSSHGYENKETGVSYTGRQVQAMWLTRAYLLLSATGIDKATMYMCEDVGTVENEAVGKYATAGVIGFRYNENGEVEEFKKDSYYYLYTLKNTLSDYTFNEEIEAYDDNVMIYKFKTQDGKIAYAVWCTTSDGTVSNNYQLKIEGDSATLVENEYGNTEGKKSTLEADSLGYVSVNVSENPIYVLVD